MKKIRLNLPLTPAELTAIQTIDPDKTITEIVLKLLQEVANVQDTKTTNRS